MILQQLPRRLPSYNSVDVQKLVHVIRTPTWIIPPRVQVFAMGAAGEVLKDIEMDGQENFSQAQIEKFHADPEYYRRFVKAIEKEINGTFPIVSMLVQPLTPSQADASVHRYSRTGLCKPSPASMSVNT